MSGKKLKVLLIEGEKNSACDIINMLTKTSYADFEIVHKKTMADTLECIEDENNIDIILLDLILPNSKGIGVFETIKNMKGCDDLPIVIISDISDIAIEAVRRGAQDFIPKNRLTMDVIVRSMRYAILRKKKEIDLEKTQERLRMALDATSDGIWDYDIKRNHIYISSKYENLLGYDTGSLCGDIEKLLDIMHPDDRERIVNHDMLSFSEREISSINDNVWKDELRLKDANGKYKWFLIRSMVIDNGEGIPSRLVGVIVDITSRKIVEINRKQLYNSLSGILDKKLDEWNEEIKADKVEMNEKLERINNNLLSFRSIS